MKQDMAMALFNGYIALIKVLQRSGAINISDLTNELGDTIDIRRSLGLESAEDQEMLEILYKAVQKQEILELQPLRPLAPGGAESPSSPPGDS